MTIPAFHPRFILPRLTEALEDTPVVLIHGPRQCGKTTLARAVGDAAGYAYISFDSDVLRASAQTDPVGFVADLPDRTVLDEVQRVPELFTALKAAVDRDRRPGRFILTGSANVLLVPRLADSLAGRMEILRLHPLAQGELAENESSFLGVLFGEGFKANQQARLGKELAERIAAGGYPAALARPSPRRRATWYRDYIETLVQRDVRDLARISSLDVLPRLLEFCHAHAVNSSGQPADDSSAMRQILRMTTCVLVHKAQSCAADECTGALAVQRYPLDFTAAINKYTFSAKTVFLSSSDGLFSVQATIRGSSHLLP